MKITIDNTVEIMRRFVAGVCIYFETHILEVFKNDKTPYDKIAEKIKKVDFDLFLANLEIAKAIGNPSLRGGKKEE